MHLLELCTGGNEVALAVLILSIVSIVGLGLSTLKFRGIGLGITGVLFSGLLFGHLGWNIDDSVLQFVKEFGLILFVFTIGLQIGPGFFSSLRQQGLPSNLCAAAIVVVGAVVTVIAGWILGIHPFACAGLFSGATTNTPSLGAVQQAIAMLPNPDQIHKSLPALAYAVAYPGGVLGIILSILLLKFLFRVDTRSEASSLEESHQSPPLKRRSLTVTNPGLEGLSISRIPGLSAAGIVISRIQHAATGEVRIAGGSEILGMGDTLLAVGTKVALDDFQHVIGTRSENDLLNGVSGIQYRRIMVTRKEPLGKSLRQLALHTRLGVIVTRIIRGDLELPGSPDLRLQYGDSLHVVGDPEGLAESEKLLGNSAKDLGHTNFLPVFIGLALGVLAGLVPLSIPGLPVAVRLGLAGGPLVVAILLSRIGQFGSIVWYMPEGANLALRELGIILFLSCVGLKAGSRFFSTLMSPEGLSWLIAGFLITVIPLLLVGTIARLVLKMNFVTLSGLIAGSMTDPPALAFANAMTGSNSASISYAAVYPFSMLLRILCAQLLVLLLR